MEDRLITTKEVGNYRIKYTVIIYNFTLLLKNNH